MRILLNILNIAAVFLTCSCGDQLRVLSAGPLTGAEINRAIGLGIPTCARDIHYVMAFDAGYGQQYKLFVAASLDECDVKEVIDALIKTNETTMGRSFKYASGPFVGDSAGFPRPDPKWGDSSWWTPEVITRGLFYDADQGRGLHMWFDDVNRKLYITVSD